jgi:membrane-associated phospholipid phosphatase
MDVILPTSLMVAAGALMFAERSGAPVILALQFKGDLKRETRWFGQYGQAACTIVAALILWRLDSRPLRYNLNPAQLLLVTVFGTSFLCMVIKRLLGRVRPGHDHAGHFLGPTWRHANYRESFPSSHSACAVAMSTILAALYPPAALIFWALALICALLRYLMDAHWPSDVVGGVALGYLCASLAWAMLGA